MIPITRPHLPRLEDYEGLLAEIWDTRMLSNFGKFAHELEGLTADRIGVPTRVVVSGDIGLLISIAALQIPAGAAVVVPSFTFNSTINAILWNRLRPVFADIDPATFNVDPADVARLCREQHAKLIIATHVFGNPADVEALTGIAADANARLLFDAAHGYGASHGGQQIGSFGDVEVFSLSGTKPVTSAEGGIISSADRDLLKRIEYLRAYGFQKDYISTMVGLNGKMSELHAALGLLSLSRIDEALAVRRRLVDDYRNRLAKVPGIMFQEVHEGDQSTFKDFCVALPSAATREKVEAGMHEARVQTKRYFLPCHQMPAYQMYASGTLPVTERVHSNSICIPLYEDLTPADVSIVVDTFVRASE